MTALLAVGTIVQVTERGPWPKERVYVARVVGYDLGHTKYHLGMRYMGWSDWRYADGGSWSSPRETEELAEADQPSIAAICRHDGVPIIWHAGLGWQHMFDEFDVRPNAHRRAAREISKAHELAPAPHTVALANIWDFDDAIARQYPPHRTHQERR